MFTVLPEWQRSPHVDHRFEVCLRLVRQAEQAGLDRWQIAVVLGIGWWETRLGKDTTGTGGERGQLQCKCRYWYPCGDPEPDPWCIRALRDNLWQTWGTHAGTARYKGGLKATPTCPGCGPHEGYADKVFRVAMAIRREMFTRGIAYNPSRCERRGCPSTRFPAPSATA